MAGMEGKSSDIDNNDDDTSLDSPTLIQFIALGDSTFALVASFLLLAVSIVIAIYMNHDGTYDDEAYRNLGPIPKVDAPRIFQFQKTENGFVSTEMRKAFEIEGAIAVRGILNKDILKQLDDASIEIITNQREKDLLKPRGPLSGGGKVRPNKKQFFTTQHGTIFSKNLNLSNDNNESMLNPFLDVALMGDIPSLAAELLQLNRDKNETLRVMRDIFLAISEDEQKYVCGWHTDDTGFWPNIANDPGVNAWIALDDMPIVRGGGFALAVGSHIAPWRWQAYNVTGSTHTFPKEGFKSAADMLQNRVGNGTCNIKTAANHLYRRMEETKRIYDIKKGDVIFHHRWLFHRSVPFKKDAIEKRIAMDDEQLLYRRYSVRYGPGYSTIPKGWGTEFSVLWDSNNGKC